MPAIESVSPSLRFRVRPAGPGDRGSRDSAGIPFLSSSSPPPTGGKKHPLAAFSRENGTSAHPAAFRESSRMAVEVNQNPVSLFRLIEAHGTRREVLLYLSTMCSATIALVLVNEPFPVLCTPFSGPSLSPFSTTTVQL